MGISSYFDYEEAGNAPSSDDDWVFLPQWSEAQWQLLLEYAETLRMHAGDLIIRKGEQDRALYVITTGSVEVTMGTGRRTRRVLIDSGSLFGELAFFDGAPRSADVTAVTDGELLRIGVEDFEALSARHPEIARDVLFDLGRLLALRLRRAQKLVTT